MHRHYRSKDRHFVLNRPGTTLVSIIAVLSLLSVMSVGALIGYSLIKISPNLVLALSFLASFGLFLLYMRAQKNTSTSKTIIRYRGFIKRSEIAIKVISLYLSKGTPILEAGPSTGLDQLLEYEKEKGAKYKLQTAAYISLLICFMGAFNLINAL